MKFLIIIYIYIQIKIYLRIKYTSSQDTKQKPLAIPGNLLFKHFKRYSNSNPNPTQV